MRYNSVFHISSESNVPVKELKYPFWGNQFLVARTLSYRTSTSPFRKLNFRSAEWYVGDYLFLPSKFSFGLKQFLWFGNSEGRKILIIMPLEFRKRRVFWSVEVAVLLPFFQINFLIRSYYWSLHQGVQPQLWVPKDEITDEHLQRKCQEVVWSFSQLISVTMVWARGMSLLSFNALYVFCRFFRGLCTNPGKFWVVICFPLQCSQKRFLSRGNSPKGDIYSVSERVSKKNAATEF